MLFTFIVITLEKRSVLPAFFSFSMLKIIYPLTFINSSINMIINSKSVCFIIDPVAFVHISVNMNEFTFALSSVVVPLTRIYSTICPFLCSISISKSTYPLSIISCSRVKSINTSLLSLGIWIVLFRARNSFTTFFECKVS